MNKALEDLQAGRDPFAPQEPESNGDVYHRMAKQSMWVSIVATLLCVGGSEALKNMTLDAKTGHYVWLGWIILSSVLFGASLISGVIALFGIRKHGCDGILTRALRGIVCSGVMVALLVTGAINGFENRKALQSVQASVNEMRDDIKKELDQKGGVSFTNSERRAQNVKNALDTAAGQMSGDDALIARATANLMGRLQALMKDYTQAATPLLNTAFISMNGVVQPLQLQAKKETVSKFMTANERMLVFVTNVEKNYTAEMNSAGVPAEAQARAMKGFRSGLADQTGFLTKIRLKDREMGTALMGMLNLLDANWGRWTYNTETKKVGFEDGETLAKYNALLKNVVTAGREQMDLQKQYFSMQAKGG